MSIGGSGWFEGRLVPASPPKRMTTATKLTLMVTHLVAAAIVIPVLTGRLPEHR